MTNINTAAKEVIQEAANLLEQKGWIQGDFAKDSNGRLVASISPDATCYCTVGAIRAAVYKASGETDTTIEGEAKRIIRRHIGKVGIAMWNDADDQTKENVISTLREAASLQ